MSLIGKTAIPADKIKIREKLTNAIISRKGNHSYTHATPKRRADYRTRNLVDHGLSAQKGDADKMSVNDQIERATVLAQKKLESAKKLKLSQDSFFKVN